MKANLTNPVGGGMDYKTPELLVESFSPEVGYCNSSIKDNSGESIGDEEGYNFYF